jgi:hypothetical protein
MMRRTKVKPQTVSDQVSISTTFYSKLLLKRTDFDTEYRTDGPRYSRGLRPKNIQ